MPFSGLKVEGIKINPIPYALTRRNLHTKGIKRAALQGRALSVELRIYENTMPRTVGDFRRFTMNNNIKQIAPLETEFG